MIEAALQSPNFLFRVEIGVEDPDHPERRKLTGHEVATRLSYFLWGTMPSADLKLPADMVDNHAPRIAEAAAPAPTGSGVVANPDIGKPSHGFRDVWYGFYPNGREVLLGV